jgi:hypothetical protein
LAVWYIFAKFADANKNQVIAFPLLPAFIHKNLCKKATGSAYLFATRKKVTSIKKQKGERGISGLNTK